MLAGTFVKAGVLTLLLFSPICAQEIPFEFWFGQIVGNPRGSLIFSDNDVANAGLTQIAGVGSDRLFDVLARDYYSYDFGEPGGMYITEPTISGRLRIGRATQIELVEGYYRSKYLLGASLPLWSIARDSTMAHLDLRGSYLESGKTTYSSRKSLLLWKEGVFHEKGQSGVETWLKYDSRGEEMRSTRLLEPNLMRTRYIKSDESSTDFEFTVSHGLMDDLEGAVLGRYLRAHGKSQSSEGAMDSLFSHSVYYEDESESFQLRTSRFSSFGWQLRYVIAPSSWLVLLAAVDRKEAIAYDSTDFYHEIVRTSELETRTLRIDLSNVWITRAVDYSCKRLLDNYTGYFEEQLANNTLMIETNCRATRGKVRGDGRNEFGTGVSTGRILDSLVLSTRLRYYALANLYSTLESRVQFTSNGGGEGRHYVHDQYVESKLTIAYQSFRWQAHDGRGLAWGAIKPIDLVLGPLLRTGDFKASVEAKLPRWFDRPYDTNRSIFSHQDWLLLRDWVVSARVKASLYNQTQIDVTVTQSHENIAEYPPKNRSFRKVRGYQFGVAVQIGSGLRLGGRFENSYSKFVNFGDPKDVKRAWNLEVRLDATL